MGWIFLTYSFWAWSSTIASVCNSVYATMNLAFLNTIWIYMSSCHPQMHFNQDQVCPVWTNCKIYYLPPAAEGCGQEIITRLPSVRASVRASVRECVRSSRFCINLNISFIYSFIFTKFAGNVYGYENLSLKNFSLILKNKMTAVANCLKIVKVL